MRLHLAWLCGHNFMGHKSTPFIDWGQSHAEVFSCPPRPTSMPDETVQTSRPLRQLAVVMCAPPELADMSSKVRNSRHVLQGQKQQKSSTAEHQRPVFISTADAEICGQVFKRTQQLEGFVERLPVNTTVGTAGCSAENLAQARSTQRAMSSSEKVVLYDHMRKRDR